MNAFTYDFVNKTIVGTKKAIDRANRGIEPEYSMLVEMMKKQPSFKVVARSIVKRDDKKTYADLTFDRMREYIGTQANADKMLTEFEAAIRVAKAKRKSYYPTVKKWFLINYPSYKDSSISTAETASEIAKIEREKKPHIVELNNTNVATVTAQAAIN